MKEPGKVALCAAYIIASALGLTYLAYRLTGGSAL